jgi:hypothetical protein
MLNTFAHRGTGKKRPVEVDDPLDEESDATMIDARRAALLPSSPGRSHASP